MTSYEIVKRTVEFGAPERVPFVSRLFGPSDFFDLWLDTPRYTPRKPGYTEWGHTMAHSEIPNNGMPADVAIATWDMLDSFRWPDPANPERYSSIAERLARPESRDKYCHIGWFMGLYDTVYRLHEFEDCMADFYLEPAKMKYLIAKVAGFMLGAIAELVSRFPGRIHGILLPDDWGGQDSTFVSIAMWEEFFGLHYRAIGEVLHENGIHFWLHSDGRINDLLPVLIDCGLDVVNMPSPHVVGIDAIAERFAGRLCFINGVDIQSTLVEGTDEEIEEEAGQLALKWHTPDGGFIPTGGLGYPASGVTDEKGLVAVNAFRKYCWGLPPLGLEEARALVTK